MARRLFERIAVLMKADAHGLVESLEERSLLLKQYLREAELALDESRARLEAARDDAKRLGDAIATHDREIAALDEDVALALAGAKDDLARFAIRRLIPRRKERAALAARAAECEAEAVALAERVERQQVQLDGLRTRVRAELARERAADPGAPPCFGEPPVTDEEVELEMMRRRAGAGGPG
jgi:phage shock protein A